MSDPCGRSSAVVSAEPKLARQDCAYGAAADDGWAPAGGFPVVLTADRSLMADYKALFDGMVSGSQTTLTPGPVMRLLLAPRMPCVGCRAAAAPLGLRRIEAAMLGDGWGRDQVSVVTPETSSAAIGPDTRIIAISCGDPLGLGMNSTTMTAISGGRIYPSHSFQRLMKRVRIRRQAALGARVVVGGPGAWQLAANDEARRELGVDHVVTGYCEGNVADLFRRLAMGEDMPTVLVGQDVPADRIPAIAAPSLMGSVEISRGCGLSCEFCSVGHRPMEHLPVETILADVKTNIAGGAPAITLVTEDVLRYGARGMQASAGRLIALLEDVREIVGARMVQADHVNIASIERYSDAELKTVRKLLAGPNGADDYVWVNVGVETASGALLAANGGRPKMGGHADGEWGHVCAREVRRLCEAGFFPLVSLMLGLPGEGANEIRMTMQWLEGLKGLRVAVFPVLHAPMDGSSAMGAREMSRGHWRLIRECYRHNFRWTPKLVWNHQTRAGVPLWRRALLQALGLVQIGCWKTLFAWRSRGS